MGEAHGAWEPDEGLLTDTLEVLRAAQSRSNETQLAVRETLRQYNEDPEFNRYLLYVLISDEESEDVAAIAGLLLKNNIRYTFKQLPGDIVEDVKTACLDNIGSPSKLIRATTGVIITTLTTLMGINEWPGLLEYLCDALDTDNGDLILGAFSVLEKVCEDSWQDITETIPDDLMRVVIPKMSTFLKHSEPQVRMYALSCLNQFVQDRNLNENPDDFLKPFLTSLYSLTEDPNDEVRANVVKALVSMYTLHPDLVSDNIEDIIHFMVAMTGDSDPEVQQEACEFWIAAFDDEVVPPVLAPELPRLVPLLIELTPYNDADIAVLRGDEDDAHIPDHAKDIRPHVVRGRAAVADEDDSDDDEDADEALLEWNLRKAAAAALDVLSTMFATHPDFLEILLGTLEGTLSSDAWEIVESGILVLGAVAQGCKEEMYKADYMPKLMLFLLDALQHPKALIRSISCFAVSRYKEWVMLPENDAFETALERLLDCVMDGSKMVQQAACTALCDFFEHENSGEILKPYLVPLVEQLVTAHGSYQRKNIIVVYDAINTLAEQIGEHLNDPQLTEVLMPCLLEKWASYGDTDPEQFPLMECLTSVVTAVSESYLPYSQMVHDKCLRMLETTAEQFELVRQGRSDAGDPDPETIVCAIDLLSASSEALGPSVESLVGDSQIVDIIVELSTSTIIDVQQSVYALIGDYARACFPHLEPAMGELIPTLARALSPRHIAVCNNAAWALGEIAMQLGENMRDYLEQIVLPLRGILASGHGTPLMRGTVAVALARLGMVCPATLGVHIQDVFGQWCEAVMRFRNNDEKVSAFIALGNAIILQPELFESNLGFLTSAVCSFSDADYEVYEELHSQMSRILQYFKEQLGGEWDEYVAGIPDDMDDMRTRLTTTFGC